MNRNLLAIIAIILAVIALVMIGVCMVIKSKPDNVLTDEFIEETIEIDSEAAIIDDAAATIMPEVVDAEEGESIGE